MKVHQPLTMLRAVAAAVLFVAGATFSLIILTIDEAFSDLFILCAAAMAALPMAGLGVVLNRSWVETGVILAIAVAMTILLSLSAIF